jgi:hypothetical protein
MAGISKIRDLEARKRALVTESEICRETLKAEVENLRLHGAAFLHKFDRVRSIGPWVLAAAPVAIPLLGLLTGRKNKAPKRSPIKGGIATGLLAVRLYRRYGPLLRSLIAQLRARRRSAAEARSPAANI